MNQNLIKKWLVVQIKPNSYGLAIRNLERQAFETFLPKMQATIKKENKFIYKDISVFPGYIFVGVDPQNSDWNKINSTYGVLKLLLFNKKPAQISNDIILFLKNKYQSNSDPIIKENLNKGDNVKFTSGPFVDLIARIEDLDHKNRIWFLLEAEGKNRKFKLQQNENIEFIKVKISHRD